jgi:hypothetical protein
MDLDAIFFNLEKDARVIKKGNMIALLFCLFSAFVTLTNGLLHIYFEVIDIKDVLLLFTIITVLPLRYFYIFKNR